MGYLLKFNYDDVYFRSLLIALLDVMSNKIYIWNRTGVNEYEKIPIPFFSDYTSDERFMQDFFMGDSLNDCIEYKKVVEGNVDVIPRGHIRFESPTIDSNAFVNRFVRGEYKKENDDGQLITYNAPIQYIPINCDFTCKILVDGELNEFKVMQKILETFYKTHTMAFLYNGFIIKAQFGIPENFTLNRPVAGYGENTDRTVEITIQVETNLPVVQYDNEFLKSHRIEAFNVNVDNDNTYKTQTNKIPTDMMDSVVFGANSNIINDLDAMYVPLANQELIV